MSYQFAPVLVTFLSTVLAALAKVVSSHLEGRGSFGKKCEHVRVYASRERVPRLYESLAPLAKVVHVVHRVADLPAAPDGKIYILLSKRKRTSCDFVIESDDDLDMLLRHVSVNTDLEEGFSEKG